MKNLKNDPKPLKLSYIERKPKLVFYFQGSVDEFDVFVRLTEADQEALLDIIEYIEQGKSLDRFYRRGIGLTRDELLEKYGVMHLHLSSKSSKALLYLVQCDSFVVLLEVNDHKHVKHPVGKLLYRYFSRLRNVTRKIEEQLR